MWTYLVATLGRQRARSAFATTGFLLAACTLILLSSATQTTVLRGNQLISQNWRPTYDLVVLPPQTHVPAGTAIPADLLEGYSGGITVAQFNQIQHLPGVAVAAPIAFLGYVQLPVPAVQFSSQPLAPGYYRLDWMVTAFNGQHQIVERRETTYYWSSDSCAALNNDASAFTALGQQHVQVLGCGGGSVPAVFPSLDTGTFLLAAIDPQAEDQLVQLKSSIVNGRMLTSQDTLHPDATFPQESDLPILLNTQLPGQVGLQARLTRIAPSTLDPQALLNQGGASYLARLHLPPALFTGSVPLAENDPQRFSINTLAWNGHAWAIQGFRSGGGDLTFLYSPSGLQYRSTTPPAGANEPAYTLVPSATQNPGDILSKLHLPQGTFTDYASAQGPEVAFRTLLPSPTHAAGSSAYEAETIGEFAGTSLASQFSDALNWLPEATYAAPPTTLRYDAQGNPVSPATLIPTTNSAGFLVQPPLALTTLAAAERLDEGALISVIRVRVNGVAGANEASWKRISHVAQEIQQETGLRALVTLGSSPQPTLVYVPGLQKGQDGSTREIAPLGWVEERWIAIGAALVYLNELGGLQLLLLGTVLLVCLGYITVTFSALAAAQRREAAILSALGWRPGEAGRLFLTLALTLALLGGVAGLGVALLLATVLGLSPPTGVVVATLPVMVGLALLSALSPFWQLRHIRPAEALRAGGVGMRRSSAGTSQGLSRWLSGLWWRVPAVAAIAVRNIGRGRVRTVIAVGSLFCSALLLTVMIDSILSLRATLTGTLLGNQVLAQTAIPQFTAVAFAVLLTFLSVADLLLLAVRERRQEIGLLRAVGWRPSAIRRVFLQEGLGLALLGAVPGALAGLVLLRVRDVAAGSIPAPLVGVGAVLLLMSIAGLAAIPAVRAANRLVVMEALRAE